MAFLQALVGSAPPSGPLQPAGADHRRIEALHWLEDAQAPVPPWALEESQILQVGGSVLLLEIHCFDMTVVIILFRSNSSMPPGRIILAIDHVKKPDNAYYSTTVYTHGSNL